jgi:hypothetical protein
LNSAVLRRDSEIVTVNAINGGAERLREVIAIVQEVRHTKVAVASFNNLDKVGTNRL